VAVMAILPLTAKSAGTDYRPLHVGEGCQMGLGLGFRPSDLCMVSSIKTSPDLFQHVFFSAFL